MFVKILYLVFWFSVCSNFREEGVLSTILEVTGSTLGLFLTVSVGFGVFKARVKLLGMCARVHVMWTTRTARRRAVQLDLANRELEAIQAMVMFGDRMIADDEL